MTDGYKNFTLSIYITAGDLIRMFEDRDDADSSKENLADKQFAFFEKHLNFTKVYIEMFRSMDTPLYIIKKAKEYFTNKGIAFATGIMPVTHNMEDGRSFCYSDPETEKKFDELFTTMANNFDEIMIDDFLATKCTCPRCVAAKGDKSWTEYRTGLMVEFCKNHIIAPARKARPDVKITLKYPTWHESYQYLGYDTEKQPHLFDHIYAGTETRHTTYSLFRNPRYTSYSLLRYLRSLPPYNNRGAWFDNIQCANDVGIYLEQAELTLLGGCDEMTLFCWGISFDKEEIGALGILLERLDKKISVFGQPAGIPVYLPFHSTGEDHVYDFLGMCGIPLYPDAIFPKDTPVFLTAASAHDTQLSDKVKKHLQNGFDVFVTAGCLEKMGSLGFADFTGMRVTSRSQTGTEFGGFDSGWSPDAAYRNSATPVTLPVIDVMLNECELRAVQVRESMPNVLLAYSSYAKGRLFVLNVPDSFSDFYEIPSDIIGVIRKNLSDDLPIWFEGEAKISLFLYDNKSAAIRSFLPYGSVVMLHIKGDVDELDINGAKTAPLYKKDKETVFRLALNPNKLVIFTWQ